MTHPVVEAPASAGPRGLIDTLQAGFNTINRNPWLLLVPLLVDLYLWLGPQFTVGNTLADWANNPTAILGATQTLERLLGDDGRPPTNMLLTADDLKGYNLFWLLAVPLLGVPSFRAGVAGSGRVFPLDSVGGVATASLAILVVGFTLAVIFYGMLARLVRTGQAAVSSFAGDFPGLWVRAVGLFCIAIGLLGAAAIPLVLLLAGTASAAPALLTVVASLILGVAVWLFIHLFFTSDALFVSFVGPLAAIRRSVVLVRHYFWQSVGFVGLIVIISSGFPIILNELAKNLQVAGTVLAICGHIYISTAISAASMTYYKERYERLESGLARSQ